MKLIIFACNFEGEYTEMSVKVSTMQLFFVILKEYTYYIMFINCSLEIIIYLLHTKQNSFFFLVLIKL